MFFIVISASSSSVIVTEFMVSSSGFCQVYRIRPKLDQLLSRPNSSLSSGIFVFRVRQKD